MPFRVNINNEPYQLEIEEIDGQKQKFLIRHKGKEHIVEAFSSSLSHYTLLVDNQSFDVFVSNGESPPMVFVNGRYFHLTLERNSEALNRPKTRTRVSGPFYLKALMSGKIVKILAKKGESIAAGQALLVLEAMKMENEICSPHAGTVQSVHVQTGQNVEGGEKLVTISTP